MVRSTTQSSSSIWFRLESWAVMVLTFNFSFLILTCGLDIEDSTPPSAPRWVKKSYPEEWPERGIDANEVGGIILEWKSNPINENIARYYIYRYENFHLNDSLGEYELIEQLEVEMFSDMKYIDISAEIGNIYKYQIRAQDVAENLGDPSDSKIYSLLQPIGSEMMSPNGREHPIGYDRVLSWHYYYLNTMENYILTIVNSQHELITRIVLQPGNYFNGDEQWQIPATVDLISGEVYKWRIDVGAMYSEGRETAGSESLWATFLYLDE
jgi:hypothetical protein